MNWQAIWNDKRIEYFRESASAALSNSISFMFAIATGGGIVVSLLGDTLGLPEKWAGILGWKVPLAGFGANFIGRFLFEHYRRLALQSEQIAELSASLDQEPRLSIEFDSRDPECLAKSRIRKNFWLFKFALFVMNPSERTVKAIGISMVNVDPGWTGFVASALGPTKLEGMRTERIALPQMPGSIVGPSSMAMPVPRHVPIKFDLNPGDHIYVPVAEVAAPKGYNDHRRVTFAFICDDEKAKTQVLDGPIRLSIRIVSENQVPKSLEFTLDPLADPPTLLSSCPEIQSSSR